MNPILFFALILIVGATCYLLGHRHGKREATLFATEMVKRQHAAWRCKHGDECGDGGL